VENKVVLRFAINDGSTEKGKEEDNINGTYPTTAVKGRKPTKVFWPVTKPYFQCTDSRFRFLNGHYFGKKGCIIAHVSPPFAFDIAKLTDEEVVKEVLNVLKEMFFTPEQKHRRDRLQPVDYKVTRWNEDPFSRGSYSFVQVNSKFAQVGELAKPEGEKGRERLFFAGEGCSISGHQCVNGAVDSGRSSAVSIWRRVSSLEPERET